MPFFFFVLAWPWLCAAEPADSSFLPVDQIHAGMQGTGLTVFHGTRIDTFQVQILGVVHNGLGPRRDLILARLSGACLAASGLVRGMSGSPVYVRDRLIGAVAYGWTFAKTPICGITPIAEMYRTLERPMGPQRGRDRTGAIHLDRQALRQAAPGLGRLFPAQDGLRMQPLATPVWVAGVPAGALATLRELLDSRGMQVLSVPGGHSDGRAASLQPGAALGVQLVSGDMSVTGIGTVTYVDQGRVLGFGHPLMLLGGTDLPLTAAHIYAIVPSQYSSFKLGAATQIVGALRQDRSQGIAGVLGVKPDMLPVRVAVENQGAKDVYRFTVARHPDLSAGLVRVVVLGVVESSAKFLGDATVDLRGRIRLDGGKDVRVHQVYSGSAALLQAGSSAASPLGTILRTRYDQLRPVRIEFSISFRESLSVAGIRSVRVTPDPVRAGDSLIVHVSIQPRGRTPRLLRTALHVPSSLPPGPVTLRVGGGAAARRWDHTRTPDAFVPRDAEQVVDLLNREYRNDVLYAELDRATPGLTLNGRELPGLPPSVRRVLEASASAGHLAPVNSWCIARTQRAAAHVLTGEKQVALTVVRSVSRLQPRDRP